MADEGDLQLGFAELAARVLQGQLAAERELVRRLARPLRLIFRVRRAPAADVDDLVQETLMIVLARLRSQALDDAEAVQAYAEAAARNVWIAEQRKRTRREVLLSQHGAQLEPTPELPPEQRLSENELSAALRTCVGELRQARDQTLLREHYLNDVDKDELCARLGLSSTHFDRTVFNARKRLAELLRKRGQGAIP